MIDFIQGELFSIEEDSIIVNVNGIGYQIFVPKPDSYQTLLNQSCFVYTHHHMREDWMGLFGFVDKDERYLFRLLLSVSGIGPKGALTIIAQSNPQQVISAIAEEDEKLLVKMPGVGKKTAQRIILDLKDKVKGLSFVKANSAKSEINVNSKAVEGQSTDLQAALKSLGYREDEIEKTIALLADVVDDTPLNQLIKRALQILMRD